MPTVTANGISVRYELEGRGRPVVLIHWLAANLDLWKQQVPPLVGRYQVLRYDLRGHGGSEATPRPYTLELLTDDLHALLQQLGIQRAVLVGLSIGGMIAMMAALRYPEMVEAMVLVDTTSRILPENGPVFNERARTALEHGMAALVDGTIARWFTAGYVATHAPMIDEVRRAILAADPMGYAGAIDAFAYLDINDQLHNIDVPALIVIGSDDDSTPPAFGRMMQERLVGSELVILPEASHASVVEQPEAFNRHLLDFLARLERP